jgi:hypothetical protein
MAKAAYFLLVFGLLSIICLSNFVEWSQSAQDNKHPQGHVEDARSSIASSNGMHMTRTPPRLLHDPLCGGCRYSHVPTTWQSGLCARWITSYMKRDKNRTLAQAGALVGRKNPKDCSRCLPDACGDSAKKYWRFDDAGPRINFGRSDMVSALPSIYRFPEEAIGTDNLKLYIEYLKMSETKLMHMFDYNPSIVQLPPDQIPHIPGETPVYLKSTRINKRNYCFGNGEHEGERRELTSQFNGGRDLKIIGFSLLRSDLSVIRETVIRFEDDRIGQYDVPDLNDLRLHNVRDKLYMSSHTWIAPFWLIEPKSMHGKRTLTNEFLTSNMTITYGKNTHCCTSDTCHGKNFNYFVDANNLTVVETNPMGPHIVEQIDLNQTCAKSKLANMSIAVISEDFPNATSFYTYDEILLHEKEAPTLPYREERGSACCVSIPDPRKGGKYYLLAGVSHSMIPYWKYPWEKHFNVSIQILQYTSRFYAFEPFPPYRLVAVSGKWCLPYPDEEEAKQNPNAKLSRWLPNRLGHVNECPHITFVTSIIEAAGDPSKMILSYGLNDCTARVVEIDKSEITRILFELPNENVTVTA